VKKCLAALLIVHLALLVFSSAVSLGISGTAEFLAVGQTNRENFFVTETWVDDDFNESTPGWGLSHFKNIQDGINFVTDGGVVHVASGSYYENVILNRTVFLVGEDRSRTIVDGNYTQDTVLSLTANYVSIEGFTIQNCIYLGREMGGINIVSWYNNVSNTYFTQNWMDITVFGKYNRVNSCTMNASFWNIKILADNNSVLENHLSNSYTAINLNSANGNSIENNTMTDEYIGISLYESTQNRIAANFAFNCSQNALRLESHSTNNIVTQNTFSNSNQGVNEDANSGTNTFYHNSFINNTLQVSLVGGQSTWDSGYPGGGNYWSNYIGLDMYEGQYQNETGIDGIGDTALTIDSSNKDRYPLMNPCMQPSPGHDVAVINAWPSKTVIGQGYNGNMTVFGANKGEYAETFNLTVYIESVAFASWMLRLEAGLTATITLPWNTTDFSKKNYTISASATSVPGETDGTDNNCTWTVHVGVPGDVSSSVQGAYDGTVNMRDITYIILMFNTKPSSSKWNPNADVNNDLIVNMRDISIAILNFNKHE